MVKPGFTYWKWRYLLNPARTFRYKIAKKAFADTIAISDRLKSRGIVIGRDGDFLTNEGRAALDRAAARILALGARNDVVSSIAAGASNFKKSYMLQLIPFSEKQSINGDLARVALDAKLLEPVASYLELWPSLRHIGAWINFPASQDAEKSQLWHRDPEDNKIVKVFIYLNDVDENQGPFSYIPETHPFGAKAGRRVKHKGSKGILDEEMNAVLPKETWLTCTGPAKTMILADTIGYHRGGKVASGNRILITFTYTSGWPIKTERTPIAGTPDWEMNAMQRAAV